MRSLRKDCVDQSIKHRSLRKDRVDQSTKHRGFTVNSKINDASTNIEESDNEYFRSKHTAFNNRKKSSSLYDADDESEYSDIIQYKEYKIEQTSYFYENEHIYVDESSVKTDGEEFYKINNISSRRRHHQNRQQLSIQLYKNHRTHKNKVYTSRIEKVETAANHKSRKETKLNSLYGVKKEQLYRNRTSYKRKLLETNYDFPNNNSVLLSLQEVNDRQSLSENNGYEVDCLHEEMTEQFDGNQKRWNQRAHKNNYTFDDINSNEIFLRELIAHIRHKIEKRNRRKRRQNHSTKLLFFNQRQIRRDPSDNEFTDVSEKLSRGKSEKLSNVDYFNESPALVTNRLRKDLTLGLKRNEEKKFYTGKLEGSALQLDTFGKQLKNLSNTMSHVQSLVKAITATTNCNTKLLNNIVTKNNIGT